MISNVRQTKSALSASFEIQVGSNVYGIADVKNNLTFGGACDIYIQGSRAYKISYDINERIASTVKTGTAKNRIPYMITGADGARLGSIRIKQSEGFFLTRYGYYEIQIWNKTYKMYSVGMGKDGMKYPIYDGDIQIALIEKECRVQNNLDNYQVYSLYDEYSDIAHILCLYIDMITYPNRGEIVTKSVQNNYKITTNKELKSKYDPNFKDLVIKRS